MKSKGEVEYLFVENVQFFALDYIHVFKAGVGGMREFSEIDVIARYC